MKTIIKYLTVAILGLGCASCEEWLDMPSHSATDSETVFKDEISAEMFILGCYRQAWNEELWYQFGGGDTAVHSYERANSKMYVSNYAYDPNAPVTLTSQYTSSYMGIEYCNMALEGLETLPESAKRNQLRGEALALRAHYYLNLMRVYGDVPAIFQPLAKQSTFYPVRDSRDVIYDQIVGDLLEATNLLPWYSEGAIPTTERISKNAAYGLLARVALYAGGYSLRWNLETNDPGSLRMARRADDARVREFYQIASNACEALVTKGENSLVQARDGKSGFEIVFRTLCERSYTPQEIMWEFAQAGTSTNGRFGAYNQPGTDTSPYGSAKIMQFLLPTFYLSYDANDSRRDVTCTNYTMTQSHNVGTTWNGVFIGKYRTPWYNEAPNKQGARQSLNIPLLRYADVLLMYAEAQNYLNGGPTAAAKSAYEEVRLRAFRGDRSKIGTTPSSQEAFFEAIVKERRWEMAGEFWFKSDLTRWNLLASELAKTKQEMVDLSTKSGAYASVPTYRAYQVTKDACAWKNPILTVKYQDFDHEPTQAELDALKQSDTDVWYPVAMFQAFKSDYNTAARTAAGLSTKTAIKTDSAMPGFATGAAENGGSVPAWINSASEGLFYGFQENRAEALPFSNTSITNENPNISQHPGYL